MAQASSPTRGTLNNVLLVGTTLVATLLILLIFWATSSTAGTT